MALCLGIDTSNYTTSLALFDGESGYNLGRLLEVPEGALGLRQSDAFFQHVKQLPALFTRLRTEGRLDEPIAAVGSSVKPRWVEGSYMPCFLAGESQGRVLAEILGVPFFACSHQQGHIAAAAWSAGRPELMDQPHLAWHLSGGTSELLLVEPEKCNLSAQKIGGTSDISAGQLLDRTGKLLGLAFPAGKALDILAGEGGGEEKFSVRVKELTFSLSGVENQVKARVERGEKPAQVAKFVLDTITDTVRRTTSAALERYPRLSVLCSGGVASNRRLRACLESSCGAVFAPARYSTDNALGVAILTHRMLTST